MNQGHLNCVGGTGGPPLCRGNRATRGWACRSHLAALAVLFAVPAAADEREMAAASALMKRELYADAAKILEKAVERQGDNASPVELRMLGENYFMLKNYGQSRTYFARALPRQTNEKTQIICESRLATVDYRLGDLRGATERIENFLRKYPNDSRVGSMAVLQVRIAQDSPVPRAEKIKKIEELFKKISGDKERYGYYNSALAAQTLGELYVEAGNEQAAISMFVSAVHEMRGLISGIEAAGRPVPPDLSQGVDGLSLQIGKFYVTRKEWGEAKKWLLNVSRSKELTAQAKYLLAQIAYQNRDFRDAIAQLSDDVLAQLPDGETKNAMFLLLGFCWRDPGAPNLEKAKEFLKKIPAASASYIPAQQTLGEIYRDQKDGERAEHHYLVSVKDPRYAAAALFGLGVILKDRAATIEGGTEADKKFRQILLAKAGAHFQELLLKYPLTDLAKQAKPLVEELRKQGVLVVTDRAGDDEVTAWEKLVKEKPKSNEAAQALLSLAQHHSRSVRDPRTKAVVKAPDWAACAQACLPLVQSQTPFAMVTPERWRELRQRALYLLARAELGSLPPGASARRLNAQVEPVRLAGGGSTERALKYLAEAESLLGDRRTPEDLRDLEYAKIEAMSKSGDKAVRDQGEKLYAARDATYGNDPTFQQLAVLTADWQAEHGFHEAAGRAYRAVAHKPNMDREQVMHLLHLAGMSYARAGRALIESRNKEASIAFLIKPPTIIRTAAEEPILKTHAAFQLTRRIPWEQQGPDLSAAEALARVSREFGVPFVWAPEEAPGSVAAYLKTRVIPRATLVAWREPRTLARVLAELVDLNQFTVDFDLGISGGTPTFRPKADDGIDDDVPTIEIIPAQRERFVALARPYGSFAAAHGGSTMLFGVLKRIEEVTGGRILWSDGVQKDEALSREFKDFPGVPAGANPSCRKVLDTTLETVGLRYQVVARDYSREVVLESIDCFDELRKFGADSVYAEDAMFNIAVNLYLLRDHGKMRLLLREYLKTYDNPSFAHYYDACFWLGRLFELEHKYRDALKYYALASEEKVVLFRPAAGTPTPTLDEVKGRLSYETLFNLSRKGNGAFKEAKLEGEFLSFIRFHTNVVLAVDPSARGLALPINRESFVGVPCLELLHDAMVTLALDLRTENGDQEVAEKAYYRMALVYKEDNLMREALENIQTLLHRFPKSQRLVDALKLKLEIHKGLRDYGAVLATLKELKAAAGDKVEPFRLDYELGRVYFDLCNYPEALACFKQALTGTKDPEELIKIREALALTFLRVDGGEREAAALYRDNLQDETSPLRQSVYALTLHWLELALSQPRTRRPLPANEAEFLAAYEKATDPQRAEMSANDLARATWIYYCLGREDLLDDKTAAALEKFDAASTSPDGFLAAEALYQSALIYHAQGNFQRARECLEHLLFSTKAVEPTVKATYELARCQQAAGDPGAAFRRLEELVTRYPDSPYAARARQDPLYLERTNSGGTKAP